MMFRNAQVRNLLSAAICLAIACATQQAHAQEAATKQQDAGVATQAAAADGEGQEAGSGKTAGKELPTSKAVVSSKELESKNARDGSEAVKDVAGVTSANAKTAENSSVNVRGIQLNLYTSYRLNGGLPTAGIITTPLENKTRLETLKGANALMFGIASPGGIVNMVTKRATDNPVNTLTLNGSSFGAYGGAFDFGRKLGKDAQFGVRINAALAHLENGVDGANGVARFGSAALDWNPSENLSFKLDFEQYNRESVEQAGIKPLKAVDGKIPIPEVPDPTKLLSGSWAVYTPETKNIDFRADYSFNKDWSILAEIGRSDSERSRFSNRLGEYDLVTGQGTLTTTFLIGQEYINDFSRVEASGSFRTGPLTHDVTFGISRAERDYNNPATSNYKQPQNIYNPVVLPAPPMPNGEPSELPQISVDTGIYGYDTVGIGQRWKVLLGYRQTRYHADNQDADGGHAITNSTNPSPAYGAIFEFARDSTVYASYMEGLEETGQAPIGTVNEFEILPPAVAKQKEIGVRTSYFPWLYLSLAYFDITRANAVTDDASNEFLIDGETSFKGTEATIALTIGENWSIAAAGQYLDAQQHPFLDAALEGKQPENTAKKSGNVMVSYRAPWAPGLTLRIGTNYVGERFVNDLNQGSIPSVTLLTAGVGYNTKIGGHKASFQLSGDNLTDKRYWNSATSSQFGAGMVRSFRFNAKFDF